MLYLQTFGVSPSFHLKSSWYYFIFDCIAVEYFDKYNEKKRGGRVNVEVCEFTSACHVSLSIHICTSSIIGNDGAGSEMGCGMGAGGCVGGESGWRVGQQVWIANPAAFCWRPSHQRGHSPRPHSCVNEEPVAGHIDGATRGQGWGRDWGVGEQDVGGGGRKGVGGEKWKQEESPHGSSRKYCRVMKTWCGPCVRWRPSAAAQQQPSRSERRGRARRAPLGPPFSEEEGVTSHLLSSLELHIQPLYFLFSRFSFCTSDPHTTHPKLQVFFLLLKKKSYIIRL